MKNFFLLLILLNSLSLWAKEEIDLSKVKKIYYLLASAKGFSRSAFGHGYLRLGISEKPTSQDYVIEFVANSTDKDLNYLRAMGIGENYDRVIDVKRYSQVIPEMNNIANRDLESTEILLTDEQRERFLEKLDLYLGMGKMYGYSFFTNNCAEAISELLNESGIEFKGLKTVIPNAIPGLLKKHQIAGETFLDPSLSNRRLNLAKKYETFIIEAIKLNQDNLKIEDLYSDSIMLRISAFTYLQSSIGQLPPEAAKGVRAYLSSFSFLENRLTRGILIDQLQGNESLPLHKIFETKVKLLRATEVTIKRSYLSFEDNSLKLKHDLSVITSSNPKETPRPQMQTISMDLTDYEVKDNGDLYLENKLLGVIAPASMSSDRMIQTHSWIAASMKFENNILSITSILTAQKPYQTEKRDYNPSLESGIKNIYAEMPMCFGLVELQKKLMERVLFLPDEEKLSDEENLFLLSELVLNKMIVVPGYSNAKDWTLSLPLEEAKKIIYTDHKKKYGTVSGAVGNWFKQKNVTLEVLKTINSLSQKGIHTPVFFRTKSKIGHAILITGMRQASENIYYLEGYDPNFSRGFSKDLFTFNTTTGKIKSPIYGEDDLKFVPINAESDLFFNDLSLDKNSVFFLKVASKKYKKYSFSISELMSAY